MNVLLRAFVTLAALSILLAACGSGNDSQSSTASADSTRQGASEGEENYDFRLFLSGAVTDTLQGSATFGKVVDSGTNKSHFVMEMQVVNDPASAVYVIRGDTSRPQTGGYELVSAEDTTTTIQDQQLGVVWRSGMRRNLTASSGTINLEISTDTLISGNMDATLHGLVVRDGGVGADNSTGQVVQIDGSFSAENGSVGYIGF